MCSPIVYLYYCYCTFINLYVGFQFFYACSFICASSGSFVRTWTVKNFFLKFEKSLRYRYRYKFYLKSDYKNIQHKL